MYDFFKNLAELNNWNFEYGRTDYQNLYNENIPKTQINLFLDPIITDSKFTEIGNEILTFSGKFMMLLSSDIDETYDNKYNDYIKPLVNTALQTFKDEFMCNNMTIKKFQTLEVINLFDFNFDGVLVNFVIEND